MASIRLSSKGIEIVRRAMVIKAFTQVNLADYCMVATQTIGRFLHGKKVRNDTALKICNILNLQLE